MQLQQNFFFNAIPVVAGAALLMFAAFFNEFPLVTSDTGTYITSGFTLNVPDDRPLMYGFFLRHISLWHSLWLVIIAQALLLAAVITIFIKNFCNRNISNIVLFFFFFLLAAFSGISWYCSQLMPDIFTSMGILAFSALLLTHLKRGEKIFFAIILIFCGMVHNSNVLLFTLLLIFVMLTRFFPAGKQIHLKKIKLAAIFIGCTWLLTPSFHYIAGGKFSVGNGSYIFLMGRLVENGILEKFLEKNCGNNEYKLCAYKDQLPNSAISFLWDFNNSPLYKTGGWIENKNEFKTIFWKSVFDG